MLSLSRCEKATVAVCLYSAEVISSVYEEWSSSSVVCSVDDNNDDDDGAEDDDNDDDDDDQSRKNSSSVAGLIRVYGFRRMWWKLYPPDAVLLLL